MLPQDTMHLIQRPCDHQGSLYQDSAGNRTTWRPDHCKETQTAVVWSCLPFIRSGQNHLARHSERGKKTTQTEEEVGRQHLGMDSPGVRQVPKGSGEQRKWWKLVAKSSVVPQRPLRLRDRWWWSLSWWWYGSAVHSVISYSLLGYYRSNHTKTTFQNNLFYFQYLVDEQTFALLFRSCFFLPCLTEMKQFFVVESSNTTAKELIAKDCYTHLWHEHQKWSKKHKIRT